MWRHRMESYIRKLLRGKEDRSNILPWINFYDHFTKKLDHF